MKICANCLCIIFIDLKKKRKEFVIFLGFENGKGELVKVYYEQRCQVCDRVVC